MYSVEEVIVEIPKCVQNAEISRDTNSFESNNMTLYCSVCNHRILNHAKLVTCRHCKFVIHMKCITLSKEEKIYILGNLSSWLCECCTVSIFPFNCIEEDHEFIQATNSEISHCKKSLNGTLSKDISSIWSNRQWWGDIPFIGYWSWHKLLQSDWF